MMAGPMGVQHGTIAVKSAPDGAEVRIDGALVSGKTPLTIENVDGRIAHRVRVSLNGYDSWEQDVHLENGQLALQLVLTPALGSLELTSTPPGAVRSPWHSK